MFSVNNQKFVMVKVIVWFPIDIFKPVPWVAIFCKLGQWVMKYRICQINWLLTYFSLLIFLNSYRLRKNINFLFPMIFGSIQIFCCSYCMLHTCFSTHPFVFKLHLIYSVHVCMLHNVIKQRNVMRVFILLFGNNYYVTWIQM